MGGVVGGGSLESPEPPLDRPLKLDQIQNKCDEPRHETLVLNIKARSKGSHKWHIWINI